MTHEEALKVVDRLARDGNPFIFMHTEEKEKDVVGLASGICGNEKDLGFMLWEMMRKNEDFKTLVEKVLLMLAVDDIKLRLDAEAEKKKGRIS